MSPRKPRTARGWLSVPTRDLRRCTAQNRSGNPLSSALTGRTLSCTMTRQPTYPKGSPTMMTSEITCPCGCRETVRATDEGFGGTTVDVSACSARRADGIVSVTYRKSAAYAAGRSTVVRHTDGLERWVPALRGGLARVTDTFCARCADRAAAQSLADGASAIEGKVIA